MSNVIDQLAGIGPDVEQAASADIARRDMLRGRAALRRRRFRRGLTGLGTTAAVAAAVVAVTTTQSAPGSTPTAIQSSPSAAPASTGFHLVDYSGPQVPGFDVEKLPEGYVLYSGRPPYEEPPTLLAVYQDKTGSELRWGKFIVAPQGSPSPPAHGTAVEVNGRPGLIAKVGSNTTQIYYSDGSHDLFMACDGLGLTDKELVEFAESVSMTDDAAATRG
jgi:hypothetical protein